MGHVFISYSHKDEAYVDRLTAYLAAAGIEVWTDKGIDYGAEWARTIDQRLRDCAAFVPVMSRNSRAAKWVAKEILLALDLHKPTLPLLLDGDRFVELLDIQHENVTGGRMPSTGYVAGLQALIRAATAMLPAGRVVAWGSNDHGQTSVPDGLTDIIAVAAGDHHSLALHRDGHVTAWGDNDQGQASVPDGLTDVIAIAAGAYHNLALHRDGDVTAWGHYGPSSPDNTDYVDPLAYVPFRIYMPPPGWPSPWEYGGGRPAIVPHGLTDVIAVAAGRAHSLALHRDGHVTAWGYRKCGQTMVPDWLTDAVAISAGDYHSLALRRDGRIAGWGYNRSGRLWWPSWVTSVVAVAAGWAHGLALHRDGHVSAWGSNRYGQATIPVGLSDVVAIAAGTHHNLALHRNGHVTAWGRNDDGQATVPDGLTDVIGIAAGRAHSLAIVRD